MMATLAFNELKQFTYMHLKGLEEIRFGVDEFGKFLLSQHLF